MTKEQFEKKWNGVSTETITEAQFAELKEDAFSMYEETGFLAKFDSPYDNEGEHDGMGFKVLRRATTAECDLEAMPIWFVQFQNGDTAYCYPEEICKAGHKEKEGVCL